MPIHEITTAELHALGDGVRLIDVRELDEWNDGHIPYAVHLPLGSVPDSIDSFDGSPTYVICKAGGRSMRACEFAAENGAAVVNVAGGMMSWESDGFEMVRNGSQ